MNGKAWRTLRAFVLSIEPLCRECESYKRHVIATEVDHVNNDPADNRLENLASLCKPCHSAKTRRWTIEKSRATDSPRTVREALRTRPQN